jgi:hypothetical protein
MKGHEFITLEGKGGVTIQCIQFTLIALHCDYEVAIESIIFLNNFEERLHSTNGNTHASPISK